MINASARRVALYFAPITTKMAECGIDTPLRQAHFLAQLAHESGQLVYTEEIASGEAYEGRLDLGNTQPGDGKRFKGRGLIQLTGRANYTRYGKSVGKDFTTDEAAQTIATDPSLAVDVSCWFWTERRLNAIADNDDVRAVTRVINGGYNGLTDRKAKLARAKFFLGC
jgi:putative chitinase